MEQGLDNQLDEITTWAAEGPHNEFRFTLFFVPHVIKHEDQYLVAYKGLPPERRKMHLAIISTKVSGTTPDEAYGWVKRSGIMGFMSAGYEFKFQQRFKKWWADQQAPIESKGEIK